MTPERPPQEILEIIGEFFEWLGWEQQIESETIDLTDIISEKRRIKN